MKQLCIVCEGHTEKDFVLKTLKPHLDSEKLNVYPTMASTSPEHYGGALSYSRLQRHITRTLKEKSAPVVTTMIDLHKLHNEFPSFDEAAAIQDLTQKLTLLCLEWRKDIVSKAQCRPERFIPYIQPHEFEALLFSDTTAISAHRLGWSGCTKYLETARNAVDTPEHMNTTPEKKPSHILKKALSVPLYDKRRHGIAVLEQIGFERIESECPHFSSWLNTLRALR